MYRAAISLGDTFVDCEGVRWWVFERLAGGKIKLHTVVGESRRDVTETDLRLRYKLDAENDAGKIVCPPHLVCEAFA